jgi:hypothetical protein
MCTGLEILSVVGTGMSVLGQVQQGKSQQEAYNAQAQATLNEGAYRADAAKQQAEKFRKAGRNQASEAKAQLAASGVKLGEGTPLEIDRQISQNAEEDSLSALLGGSRATTAAQEEAKLLGKAGGNAVTNAGYGAASSVMQTGAAFAKSGWKTKLSAGG